MCMLQIPHKHANYKWFGIRPICTQSVRLGLPQGSFMGTGSTTPYHILPMMCKSSNSQVQVKTKSAWICIKSSQVQVRSLNKLNIQVKSKSSQFSTKIGLKSKSTWTCTSLYTTHGERPVIHTCQAGIHYPSSFWNKLDPSLLWSIQQQKWERDIIMQVYNCTWYTCRGGSSFFRGGWPKLKIGGF